jgi:type IV pilus assembly protein PilQ
MWNFFRSKSKEPAIDLYTAAGTGGGDTLGNIPPTPRGSFNKALGILQSPPSFTFANIDALVKFFGTNDLGDVLTSPDIIVRNGKEGKIQVGKDIFVTTRDIAGNTINQQISTGTIIEVTPMVFTQSDTDFVYLNLTIEQSDVSAGPEINRSTVKTHVLLYDGEETVIGGLISTLDQQSREGVPFLKDLPWWFFGLRYIFGSDSRIKNKSELIILLKAELTDPIRDRMVVRQSRQELINEKRKEYQKEFDPKKK